MKNSAIRKVLVILIAAVLLVCLVLSPITVKEAWAADALCKIYDRASVSYRAGEGTKTDTDVIFFNPDFFAADNQVLSAEMAKVSVALATAAYDWGNLSSALTGIGFTYDGYGTSGTKGNWNRIHTVDDNDFVKYVIAERKATLTGDDKESLLLIVTVQGTNGGHDWDSNFNIGNGPDHRGFYTAHDDIMIDLYNIMSSVSDTYDENHIYVLVTGHSRGAAVANIVAGELTYGYSYRTV